MITIKTEQLKSAISALLKITATKMYLPILTCVKLEQKGTTLQLSASNLDEYQVEEVECSGKLPVICVSLKYLSYSIGQSEETTLAVVDGYLNIMPSGAQIAVNDAAEFPPQMGGKKMESIAVNCNDLAACISAVERFRTVNEERFALQPIHVTGSPKSIYAEASDGRRLAWIEKAVISVDFDILVMGNFCANFCDAARRDGAVLSRNETVLAIKHSSGLYTCKIPGITYPNTAAVIPKEIKTIGTAKIGDLIPIISLGLHLSSGRFYQSARFEFDATGLRLSFNDPKHSAKMDTKISGDFKNAVTCLDLRYAIDGLNAIKETGVDSVTVKLNDEFEPVMLDGGELKVLIMSVRLT